MKLVVCFLGLLPFLQAQSADTAAVRGRVRDVSGAAIAHAQVDAVNQATGFRRSTRSDDAGVYTLADLPLAGEYTVVFSLPDFAAQSATVALRAGESATLDAVLAPQSGSSAITVYGTADGIRADSPESSTRLSREQLRNTPLLGGKITSLPLLDSAIRPARGTGDLFLNNTLFVANAAGRRQTTFVIDGAAADDAWGRQTIFTNLPLVSIDEFNVIRETFSAEHGRTAGSVVNVNTRSGTNDFHGDILASFRPGEGRPPDRLRQFSAAAGGPIRRDRTHYLISGEVTAQERDSSVTSALAPQVYRGEFRQKLGLLRLDHRLSDRHWLAFRASLDRFSDTNPQDAVGLLVLPSAARVFRRAGYATQLGDTLVLSPHVLNQARASFLLGSPITQFDPLTPGIQYVRPGLATEGESRSANLRNRQWQLSDTLAFTRGSHSIRAGGDALHSDSGGAGQEFGGGYVLGQFTLKPGVTAPVAQLKAADIQRYTQSFGNASYRVSEWLGSIFLQDNWKAAAGLAINLGLRYERQSLTDDAGMWSPRIGLAWNPRGDRRMAVRAGYGVFYSQIRANTAAGYEIGGPAGIFSFTAAPGQAGFPDNLQTVPAFPAGAVLPARDITVRWGRRAYLSRFFDVSRLSRYPDVLLNPRTQQLSVAVERELARKLVFEIEYVHQLTTRIDRPLDLNAPAPFPRTAAGQTRSPAAADLTRPIVPAANGYRRILATVNDGIARYDGLHINLKRRFAGRASFLASYTLSHAINTVEPDVPNQDPNEANLLGRAERATSLLDQRHRAVLSGWVDLPLHLSFGSVASLASGRPFNIVTGVDNNGDNSNTDRPVVNGALLGRNAGRGTPVYDVQIFLGREFTRHFSVRAEAFNVLNHSNVVGRNATWGNGDRPAPAFGQALGGVANVDPSRQFQFTAALRF